MVITLGQPLVKTAVERASATLLGSCAKDGNRFEVVTEKRNPDFSHGF